MPSEHRHHPSGDLRAAALLAGAAGFLDAFVFLRVSSTFVANMSGNLVRLGMGLGDGQWQPFASAAIALVSFATGAVAATITFDRQLRRGAPRVRPLSLLLVEAALIAAVMVTLLGSGADGPQGLGARTVPVIVVAAMAMGLQATALRAVGQVAVSTTYGTGAVVRLSEKVALGIRRAERPLDMPRRESIRVLAIVLLCYVGGAAAGAATGRRPLVLLVPIAAVVTAGASVERLARRIARAAV